MKPHIFFRYGQWHCRAWGVVSTGDTPMHAWARVDFYQRERAMRLFKPRNSGAWYE